MQMIRLPPVAACCKEIPLDAAFTPEGAEYVEHFCGLECYQRFQARAKAGTKPVLIRTPAARCRQTEAYPNLMSGRPRRFVRIESASHFLTHAREGYRFQPDRNGL
jgi:hypothetical protein